MTTALTAKPETFSRLMAIAIVDFYKELDPYDYPEESEGEIYNTILESLMTGDYTWILDDLDEQIEDCNAYSGMAAVYKEIIMS